MTTIELNTFGSAVLGCFAGIAIGALVVACCYVLTGKDQDEQ